MAPRPQLAHRSLLIVHGRRDGWPATSQCSCLISFAGFADPVELRPRAVCAPIDQSLRPLCVAFQLGQATTSPGTHVDLEACFEACLADCQRLVGPPA